MITIKILNTHIIESDFVNRILSFIEQLISVHFNNLFFDQRKIKFAKLGNIK